MSLYVAQFSADCAAAHNQRRTNCWSYVPRLLLNRNRSARRSQKKQSQQIEQEEVEHQLRPSMPTKNASRCWQRPRPQPQRAKKFWPLARQPTLLAATDARHFEEVKGALTSLRATLASETEICHANGARAPCEPVNADGYRARNLFSPTFKWSTWKGGNSASPEGASPGSRFTAQ